MSFNAGPRFFSESIPEEQRIFFQLFWGNHENKNPKIFNKICESIINFDLFLSKV